MLGKLCDSLTSLYLPLKTLHGRSLDMPVVNHPSYPTELRIQSNMIENMPGKFTRCVEMAKTQIYSCLRQ